MIIWILAVTGSYLATLTFGPTFQPALALCIPDVPLVFFVIVFAAYCIGLVGLTTGYVLAFARRRRRKRKEQKEKLGHQCHHHMYLPHPQLQNNAPFEPTPSYYIEDPEDDDGEDEDNFDTRFKNK